MPAPTRPVSAKTFQRERVIFVPTIASATLAPTVSELTGASAFDVTQYLFGTWGRPTQNTNRVQLARRLGDGAQYEQIGTSNYTGGDLQFTVNPQAAANSVQKAAFEKLPEGTVGFLWRRLVTPLTVDVAAGQFGDTFPVEFGPAMPGPSSDGEEQEAVLMQSFAVTGPPAFIKAVLT